MRMKIKMKISGKNSKGERPWEGALALWGGGNRKPAAEANRRFEYLFSISDQPIAEPEKVEAEGVEPSSRGRLMPTSTCVGHSLSHHSRRR